MTTLLEKSMRWLIIYKDGSTRYSNLIDLKDVYHWERKVLGNSDKLDEVIPNPLYEPVQRPKWE